MKLLLQFLLILLLSALLQLVLPWWIIILTSFVVCALVYTSSGKSFLAGFLAIALLWFFYAFYTDIQTHSILSSKMAALFGLSSKTFGGSSPPILCLITGLIGGIAGGSGALSGHLFRAMFVRKKKLYY